MTVPAAGAGSAGFPVRFCRLIQNCLRRVLSVVSCFFRTLGTPRTDFSQSDYYRDITRSKGAANGVKRVTYTTVSAPETSVERILVLGRNSRSVHFVLVDNSVSLMSLVDLPGERRTAIPGSPRTGLRAWGGYRRMPSLTTRFGTTYKRRRNTHGS